MRFIASTLVASIVPLASALPSSRHQPADGTYGVLTEASQVANKSFDYIICGGGLTGLTVANRLSEDPRTTVLVIENGQDNHNDPRVYDVRTYGEAFATDLDYNLTSTPVASQNDTGLLLVAGRTLGGSGSINGASWTKGAESQYNLLPGLTGDESWGFGPVNELMLKSENFHEPTKEQVAKGARFQRGYHGRHGEVEVSFAAGLFGSIQQPALQASQKVWSGLQRISDLAAGVVNGASIIPNMLHAEESQNRSSPFTAHAQWQVQQRDNLMILTGHRVTSINWRPGKNMVAEGVTFQSCRDCDELTTEVKREVLLAAGSLQSPQLLELSGVGDPEVLAAAGVPLKMASRGVGKNMQEQTKNSVMYNPKFTHFEGSGPPAAIAFPNVDQLFGGNSSQIYEEVMSGLSDYSQQLEADGLVANGTATLAILQFQVNNLWKDKAAASEVFFTLTPSSNQVGIDLWNLIVLSRGYVHIKSNSSWDHPIIEPSYFGHPLDLKVQTATAMQSREVYQTEPLASYVANETYPGAAVPQNASAQMWEQWVQQTFTSVWHYIATLSMMKEERGGVVDNRLKVYGIENVRAVDASVLPIQLSAHLSSSLYGIAEKAAVMIKEDHREATRGLGQHGSHESIPLA